METYLLIWNPKFYQWDTLEEDIHTLKQTGFLQGDWSTGRRKNIKKGDRLFLIRLGKEPRGLVASGRAISEVFEGTTWNQEHSSRIARYIPLNFDVILNAEYEQILFLDILKSHPILRQHRWEQQISGTYIPEHIARELELVWERYSTQCHKPYKTLRLETQNRVETSQYWWFGINNIKARKKSSYHVIYSDIEPFLSGQQHEFSWPYGGAPYSKKFYSRMHVGDKVVLWMGHGYFEQWGILGFASISAIRGVGNDATYCLNPLHLLTTPFTPYPKNHPEETKNTLFLRETFGVNFYALKDVFYQVKYSEKRTTPVTIDEMTPLQYAHVFERCTGFPCTHINTQGTFYKEFQGDSELLPEEFIDRKPYVEGTQRQIQVTVYERNPHARKACLDYYGTVCQICGFDFEARYGEIGRGIIHVHHRKPLSEIGQEYQLNPIRDLLPVCPNCHTIIHRRNPAYTVEEIKKILTQYNENFYTHTN